MNSISTLVREECGRIRAFWRVLIPISLALTIVYGAQWLGLVVGLGIFLELGGKVLAIIIVLWVGSRWIDNRPIKEYGLDINKKWWTDLISGFIIGTFVVGIAWSLNIALGWSTLTSTLSGAVGPLAIIFPMILVFIILTSLWEEIVFRGTFIVNATEGFTKRGMSSFYSVVLALTTSTFVFAIYHFLVDLVPVLVLTKPPGVPISVMLMVFAVGGVTFGIAYIFTGSLAAPIGLHTAYNLMRFFVFGDTAPPLDDLPALLRFEMDFPGLWEATRGFEYPMYFVGIFAIILWVYLTRGEISLDESLVK